MLKIILFLCAILVCLIFPLNAAHALLLGIVFALLKWVPERAQPGPWSKKLLALAIVGLGFAIELSVALEVGRDYMVLIMLTVMFTLLAGWWLARGLKVARKTGFLISSGTAICGGSAIAAVAPSIRASSEQIAIAMGCVFILNALAIVLFPIIGSALSLDPHTFGVWAAVAIHDTSSVVGAAQAYHPDALASATTLKLARALLIVPLVLLAAYMFAQRTPHARDTMRALPNFIGWFIAAIIVAQIFPQAQPVYEVIQVIAQKLLVVSLFLVGSSLNLQLVRQSGTQPILLATILWFSVAGLSLSYLVYF
ncbi:MAG: putative sulfate exporter family transporter [Idiomarina sp.]|nr:putative sulfate exporter family transporter [Idiomarina sp.]